MYVDPLLLLGALVLCVFGGWVIGRLGMADCHECPCFLDFLDHHPDREPPPEELRS